MIDAYVIYESPLCVPTELLMEFTGPEISSEVLMGFDKGTNTDPDLWCNETTTVRQEGTIVWVF